MIVTKAKPYITGVLMVLFGLALLFPLLVLLVYSMTKGEVLEQILFGMNSRFADHRLFRWDFDLTFYRQIWMESRKFATAFLNSWLYSVSITLGQLLIGLPAAIALSVLKAAGRRWIIPMYMILMMMPFQVTMVPSFLTLHRLDLLDHPLAIILPQIFNPFFVVLLYLYTIRIPFELFEAARVDGANTFQLIRHVVLPLILHGLWAVGLIVFIDSWNMIEQPVVFLSSLDRMPLSILIRQALENSPVLIFVPAVLFLLPILILYGLFHRSIISGLQMSIAGTRSKAEPHMEMVAK